MVNDPHPLEHSAVGEKASVSESGSSDADLQYLHRSLRKVNVTTVVGMEYMHKTVQRFLYIWGKTE